MEPEILPDGDHDLQRCQYVTEKVTQKLELLVSSSLLNHTGVRTKNPLFLNPVLDRLAYHRYTKVYLITNVLLIIV